MVRRWKAGGMCLAAGLLTGCGGGSGSSAPAATACVAKSASTSASALSGMVAQAESLRVAADSSVSPLQPYAPRLRPQTIALGDVSLAKVAAVKPLLERMGVPHQIGLPRDVTATATVTNTAARLQWQATPSGGQVAAISISSGLAQAVRLGVLVRSLPASATLRVYAQGAATAYTIAAQEVLDTLQRNRTAGDASDAGRTFWTPLVDGTEATLEVELPAAVATEGVQIAIPRLSHLFDTPLAKAGDASVAKAAGSCEVDVACNTGYSNESNSVARMNFVDPDGSAYLCTGTLVNDSSASGTPYFLGANHCISTQTAASTLQTWWFYRASSCNSLTVDTAAQTRTGGASLLYASANTDTSFMRLASTPPAGAVFAGWSVNAPSVGAAIATLHHPDGDVQKISTGSIASFLSCTLLSAGSLGFTCSTGTQANSNFVNAQFSSGATEAGSSGAPLFETVGSSHYLVGQLYGGSSSCINPMGSNAYGRFDLAYTAALSQWLAPTACP